jgi:hypothetical protein
MQTIPEAVRRALRPRRSIPSTVSSLGRKPIEALRKKLATGKFTYKQAIARGVRSKVSPELEPLRTSAYALIDDLSLERLRATSLESLAGFVCLTRTLSHELDVVPTLVTARGLADLVEVATLALEFSVESPGNWTVEIYLQRHGGKRSRPGSHKNPTTRSTRALCCSAAVAIRRWRGLSSAS